MDAAQKLVFCFFRKKKKYKRRSVWMLWRFMLASTAVSCDGVLCVKEVRASVQQGRLYKPLADFILIYELLFPITYSIFISYIYLFWEYIFSSMKLNNKKKIEKETRRVLVILLSSLANAKFACITFQLLLILYCRRSCNDGKILNLNRVKGIYTELAKGKNNKIYWAQQEA